MKHNAISVNAAVGILLTALFCAAATEADAQGGFAFKKKGSGWKNVDKISYRAFGDQYDIVDGNTRYQVKRTEVIDMKVPRPKTFDSVSSKLMQGMPGSSDIMAMETIAKQYAMLQWDEEAYTFLVPIYEKRGDDAKIIAACGNIEKLTGKVPEVLLSSYWGALRRDGGSSNKLKVQITKAIESGSRGSAAAAYVARGDILAGEGKPKEALIEGYFRTVILFEDIKAIQPEALYKTWKTMSGMGDRRGEKFRRKLVDEFPRSRYSKEFE